MVVGTVLGWLLVFLGIIGPILVAVLLEEKRSRALWILNLVWIGFLVGSFVSVPQGYVGIHLRFEKVVGVLQPGLNMRWPGIDNVVNMSIQTQKYEAEAEAASKDLQDVKTSIAVNYRLDPSYVGEVYSTIGTNYIAVIAQPLVQEVVKEITARFNAEDMITKRPEVKDEITTRLKERLAERHIEAEAVNVTNFLFSAGFTQAIEAKVVAIQKVLEAENKLRQVEVEARQAKQRAEGEANAAIEAATGQAKAITIVTQAQYDANKKINESLNDDVLQYILLDRLGKDIKVMVIPAGSNIAIGGINP